MSIMCTLQEAIMIVVPGPYDLRTALVAELHPLWKCLLMEHPPKTKLVLMGGKYKMQCLSSIRIFRLI
jgi:hypothetical protein